MMPIKLIIEFCIKAIIRLRLKICRAFGLEESAGDQNHQIKNKFSDQEYQTLSDPLRRASTMARCTEACSKSFDAHKIGEGTIKWQQQWSAATDQYLELFSVCDHKITFYLKNIPAQAFGPPAGKACPF